MLGIVDVGGGMKAVYSAGIYDYLIDRQVKFDYGIGVSAGASNMISYVTGQRGRDYTYYADSTFRKDYMGMWSLLHTGSYLNLDYIYTTLCNTGGDYPIDYTAFCRTAMRYYIVATDAQTGEPRYFDNSDIRLDSYEALKASCAIPVACRPPLVYGRPYFDGGVADPVPYKKALADGCDRLVVLLMRPADEPKQPEKFTGAMSLFLKKYPAVMGKIKNRHVVYNDAVAELKKLEKEGRALIVSPSDTCGVGTFTKDREAYRRLYEKGYRDAEKIGGFAAG